MPIADPTFLALQSALAGEYSLERELGHGGMGIVYLAREVQLDRLVAIKALPSALIDREDVRERFLREARTAAGLSHPNIVPIHRVGKAEEIPYFVMTYVRGETLGERLRARGPLSATMLTRVMREVALALGHAHGRGIVHRDVKPDNILIEETSERALVTDFGIAHVTNADTTGGPVMGTAQFMSPEQARGEPIDGRSDVYSLGVVGYLAATGKLPVADSRQPVAVIAGGITASLARTIDRCLEPDNNLRFATAEQVAESLITVAENRSLLPAALAQWASRPAPMLGVYGLWTTGFLWGSMMTALSGGMFFPPTKQILEYLGLAMLPALPISLFQLHKTERVLAAGYSIDDLRIGLRQWVRQRRAELSDASRQPEPAWTRALRLAPVACAVALPLLLLTRGRSGSLPPFINHYVVSGLLYGGMALIAIGAALSVPLLPPAFERNLVGRIRSGLWNSRLGAWLVRRLTPIKPGIPDAHFRPTEMALERAVDDLFAALPTAYRESVGDLPPIARRLSQHVGELRVEVERLETMKTHARRDEVSAIDPLLGAARQQLGQSVTALERLRVELLRLHGGTNDLRPLSTSLDSARAMVDDLVRLREAEVEVEPRLQPRLAIEARSPSPA